MSKYVTAIDLGTTKVVTIVGEMTSIGVKIIGYSEAPSSGVMRGEVINIQKVLEALLPTIKEIEEQIDDFKVKDVYVGIAGQNIRCDANSIKRHRSNPSILITKQEIDTMQKEMYQSRVAPGEQVLHVIPQSYNIDEHMGIPDAIGMDGKEIDGNYRLFIGRTNSATHSESVIRRANLNLKHLILEPIASAKALLTDDEMELGVAMVDIGGGTTDLLIYYDNIIRHTAVIPFGGNSITEDIRQICGVSLKHAEALKKQHGSCISEFAPENKSIAIKGKNGEVSKEVTFKLLSSAIEARVSEIIATVMYEIEKSSYKDKIRRGIVLTGGSSQLNHIQNLTKQITGYNVRIAFPDTGVITPNSREEIYKPSASTAVGLILKGFEYEEDDVDIVEENIDTDIFGKTINDPQQQESLKRDKEVKEIKENKERPNQRIGLKKRLGGLIDDIFATPDNEA